MITSVCVVGNGPTATGKGHLIDAADFVVRIKAWWAYGAENAGQKCDATVWFGRLIGWDSAPKPLKCEHWFAHAFDMVPGQDRLRNLSDRAGLQVIRWIPVGLSKQARDYLGSNPTSGFLAVTMAIAIFHPVELRLYGFDSCGEGRPNYDDARRKLERNDERTKHNQLREKQVLAELFDGTWLGDEVETQLKWHAMPDIGEVAQ